MAGNFPFSLLINVVPLQLYKEDVNAIGWKSPASWIYRDATITKHSNVHSTDAETRKHTSSLDKYSRMLNCL